MSRPLAALVEDLLIRMAHDCPRAFEASAARCAGLSVAVSVDGEAFAVEVTAKGPVLRARVAQPVVRVEASTRALRDVLLGDVELVDALRDERVRAYGPPWEFVRLDDLVRLLVAGAARTSGAEPLLDEFLSLAGGSSAAVFNDESNGVRT